MVQSIISEPTAAPQAPVNTKAAMLIFKEISWAAYNADELCKNIPVDSDPEALELQIGFLRDTVCRLGWLADFGAKKTGNDQERPGGADAWLLSPRCLEAQGSAA